MNASKRKSSFELLRIIAMCMIIAMHYMTKGMSLPKLSVDYSLSNHLWWLFYGFCLVAPNAYVLISGYFLVDKWNNAWNVRDYVLRGVRLLAEVLFYSWLVPLVLGAFGIVDLAELDFGTRLTILLPIEQEHYWFATSYLMLYILSPVLSMAIKRMSRQQLGGVIIVALVIFSGLKSINPYLISWDKYGCDLAWFICLYLIAAYVKLYGIKIYRSLGSSLGLYIGAVVLYFAECALAALIVRRTGSMEYFMDMIYSYNHVLVLVASVSFFYIFVYLGECSPKLNMVLCRLGSVTFGVYLLHENLVLRHSWYGWLGIDSVQGKWYQPLHMILCVVIVFALGTVVDMVRQGVFTIFTIKKNK